MTFQIDAVGWKVLKLLQEDARLSFREIGEAVGLTAPAVAERVRRLEDAGVIKGYHAEVDLSKVGLPVMAFIHLTTNAQQSRRIRTAVLDMLEVVECYCITGSESYILKVAVVSIEHLERVLLSLKDSGEVRTSVVLSAQVTRRVIEEQSITTEE